MSEGIANLVNQLRVEAIRNHRAATSVLLTKAADALEALSPPLELGGEGEAIGRAEALCHRAEVLGAGSFVISTKLVRAILSRRSTLPVGSQGVMTSVAESAGEEPDGSFASEGQRKPEGEG